MANKNFKQTQRNPKDNTTIIITDDGHLIFFLLLNKTSREQLLSFTDLRCLLCDEFRFVSGLNLLLTVFDLQGGEYEFRVKAVNAAGPSRPSATAGPLVIKDQTCE